jgi:hypothetical protein
MAALAGEEATAGGVLRTEPAMLLRRCGEIQDGKWMIRPLAWLS